MRHFIQGPCHELLNGCLNPRTTILWLHINTKNNKKSFLPLSYHLNEMHAYFIGRFNNVDSYAFYIIYNTCALFTHCSIRDKWLHCTEVWVEAITAGPHIRWKHQWHVDVTLHFHLGDLHFFGSQSSMKAGLLTQGTVADTSPGWRRLVGCCVLLKFIFLKVAPFRRWLFKCEQVTIIHLNLCLGFLLWSCIS